MIWVEVEMGWVEGAGWSWVHGIVTPNFKNFSNELAPVLLDVYNSQGKFGTVGVASRTGIIYLPYIADCRHISFLNLDYKIYANSFESNAKNIQLL